MEKIIYSKFSNDRDPEFCIATKVIETADGRYVRKEACGGRAEGHVRSIAEHRAVLAEKYKDTDIRFAMSEPCPKGVRIEWVQGASYGEYLDGLLREGRTEECVDSMERYFAQAFGAGVHDFAEDEETIRRFGRLALAQPVRAVSGVDVDMLFCNVIYDQGIWTDYDYEWFMDCDVPVKFLIYRCLLYYLTTPQRMCLLEHGVYERFGITAEDRVELEKMEARLQQYVEGTTVPMWKLYKKIRGTVTDVRPIVERRKRECWTQVYYDSGSGFSERESRRVMPEEFASNMFRIRLKCPEGVKVVRFDPAWSFCSLELRKLADDGGRPLDHKANGDMLGEGRFLFLHDDPQIWIDVREDTGWIDLEYRLGIIDLDDVLSQESLRQQREDGLRQIGELNGQLQQSQQREQRLQAELQETRQLLQMRQEELLVRQEELQAERRILAEMEASASWKITRPLRAVSRKLRGNAGKEN